MKFKFSLKTLMYTVTLVCVGLGGFTSGFKRGFESGKDDTALEHKKWYDDGYNAQWSRTKTDWQNEGEERGVALFGPDGKAIAHLYVTPYWEGGWDVDLRPIKGSFTTYKDGHQDYGYEDWGMHWDLAERYKFMYFSGKVGAEWDFNKQH